MIQRLVPTSKISLKQGCLIASNGDLEKAQKLYDYMIQGMEDLPMYDPVQPSTMEQVKNGVSDTFQWVNQNQDNIMNWVGIIKSLFNKGGGGGMPPSAAAQVAQPLPPING